MLGSKEGTQSAFFSTFEALVPHGKQIVLTSDTYAKQLKDVDERLKACRCRSILLSSKPEKLF
jgi:chromosomal replication initiator protein